MKHGELIFGTDGVRDRAGQGYLAPDAIVKLARATSWVLAEGGDSAGRAVLIGRDTRESGPTIVQFLHTAFRYAGIPVVDLGVIPTPGVAFLTAAEKHALLGVVVSASHNPAEYNGIKFLATDGSKVAPEFERRVSDAYWRSERLPNARLAGALRSDEESVDRYSKSLISRMRHPERLAGRKVVLDTAHGATFEAAPRVFRALGAEVVTIGDRPDGRNINSGCGAVHPDGLARAVVEQGAWSGFSFDGDGDRMIPVAGGGAILDGDHVLAIAGKSLRRAGRLPRGTVVATVMSNLGLEKALAAEGLRLLRTPVGDRHVYEAMLAGDHPIGGEQSGHLIFLEEARTGDGILAALKLIDSLEEGNLDMAAQARIMVRYPQVLLNYKVPRKVPFEELPRVGKALADAEAELSGDGRIVLRYSGTEPLARVMIEGPEKGQIERLAKRIGEEILASIKT